MSIIFCDYLWKAVECYVDDIAVISHNNDNHLHDLRTTFVITLADQQKMKPIKSFLGVSSGKFLGFIITSKGIHLTPTKSKSFRVCSFQRPSKSLQIYNAGLPIFEDSSQIYWIIVNLLQG